MMVTAKALRFLPAEMPGKARLAKWLLTRHLKSDPTVIVDRGGLKIAAPDLHEPIAFHLLIDGVYEKETHDFLANRLGPGSVFVDIGANVGAFTLPMARRVGSGGRVIAIEASPSVFSYLKRNVELNDLSNVGLWNCAATDREEEGIPFWEPPSAHFGMGSLAAQFHDHPTLVPTRTLDWILKAENVDRVDVLKVDVEGFEAAVFRGAEELLTGPHPPMVVFEFCDWAEERATKSQPGEAQRILRQWEYRIWRLSDLNGPTQDSLDQPVTSGTEMLVGARGATLC
jgi:FkbM family methyltransferase